jgi:glycosyltransferase involved in cell wall biosynthesis
VQKILIVTRHTPLPWEDGAGAYLHDLARFLAASRNRVDVLWLAPHDHLRWSKLWRLPAGFDARVRLHLPGGVRIGRWYVFPSFVWLPFKARLLDRVRRGLSACGLISPRRERRGSALTSASAPAPRPWSAPPASGELALVQKFARRRRPRVVIANYAWLCPVFDVPALRRVSRICIAHDIGWKRAALSAAPAFTRSEEARWVQSSDLLVAISEDDARELRALAPSTRVLVAPKAIVPSDSHAETGSPVLLFVGSDNAFNAEGLAWFLNEVWPQVVRAVPDVSLHVCGSVHRAVATRLPRVTFHGVVPCLASRYRDAALVIVPLLRATGLNIKLVEASAHGRAVVTTPATLVGAPFLRESVAVAESSADFSAAVTRLLASPSARTALAGRALDAVRLHLTPAACYGPLAAALRTT